MLKVRRSSILLMGPVRFAPNMACSVVMVYFTMTEWLFQFGVGNFILAPILESLMSIQKILRLDGGGCTVSMSWFCRLMACSDNIRRSLC